MNKIRSILLSSNGCFFVGLRVMDDMGKNVDIYVTMGFYSWYWEGHFLHILWTLVSPFTHRCRVTYISVNWTVIGSDNGFLCLARIYYLNKCCLITNLILENIFQSKYTCKKAALKKSSAKWWPFWLNFSVLRNLATPADNRRCLIPEDHEVLLPSRSSHNLLNWIGHWQNPWISVNYRSS